MPRRKSSGQDRGRAEKLGRIIRAARERLGLSREQLAREADISAEELKKLEAGAIASPGIFSLSAICSRLGVNLAEVVGQVSERAGGTGPGA